MKGNYLQSGKFERKKTRWLIAYRHGLANKQIEALFF